jgi:hypothetical protein
MSFLFFRLIKNLSSMEVRDRVYVAPKIPNFSLASASSPGLVSGLKEEKICFNHLRNDGIQC